MRGGRSKGGKRPKREVEKWNPPTNPLEGKKEQPDSRKGHYERNLPSTVLQK